MASPRSEPSQEADKTESGTTWALDVLVEEGVATFRLVRTATSAGSTTLKCKVTAYSSAGGSVTITGSSTTFQNVTDDGVYEGALLTKVDGKVGIGTDVPEETLDVVGNFRVSGNATLQGLSKSTTGNALYINAATGRLTYGEIVHELTGVSGTLVWRCHCGGVLMCSLITSKIQVIQKVRGPP